jgi:DNA-binding transcriptional LysR family regulator
MLVVKNNSFSKTAEQLNIQHTTVSRRIKNLEEGLSEKIFFIKPPNSMFLTEYGKFLFDKIQNEFENLQSIVAEIEGEKRDNEEASGLLRVQLPIGLARSKIAERIPDFLDRYKNLSLIIRYSDIPLDIIKHKIDVAIINHIPTDLNQKFKKIYSTSIGLFATTTYLKHYSTPKTLDDLRDHLVVSPVGMFFEPRKTIIFTNMKTHKEFTLDINSRFATGNEVSNIKMILSNKVIAPLYNLNLKDLYHYISPKELVAVLPDYQVIINFYLVKHPYNNSKNISVFCDFIHAILEDKQFTSDQEPDKILKSPNHFHLLMSQR